ncbi:hypothetical protein RAC89_20590 [Paenibacillus sp. GD4]|uniref:hypothetical protein n=1 Tax=Paenibacillus TaxID=44249 RepID=UPI002542BB7B|nr:MULTISPECIES: hypothetical protein [Paenibacillus]MDQ1912793.1 hypothetical protein [Paenibacillus sp. GD4]
MISEKFKPRVLWFINEEIESTLRHLEGGLISKDQAIGSLNTIYRIASSIESTEHMRSICQITSYIRSSQHYFRLLTYYRRSYYGEVSGAQA